MHAEPRESTLFMDRQKALQAIPQIRAISCQIAMFSLMRSVARTPDEERACEQGLTSASEAIESGLDLLVGQGKVRGFSDDAASWVREGVARQTGSANAARRFLDAERLVTECDPADRDKLLDLTFAAAEVADKIFQPAMHKLCADLAERLEQDRQNQDSLAAKVATEAREVMARIASISRRVRFISINASVEAARVGDYGRGFTVIASEIKSQAEAIGSAGEEVEVLLASLPKMGASSD